MFVGAEKQRGKREKVAELKKNHKNTNGTTCVGAGGDLGERCWGKGKRGKGNRRNGGK